jgi:hypothetical protein
MQPTVHLVLLVLAFVCFLFSAWQYSYPQVMRVISIGLAALTLAFMV